MGKLILGYWKIRGLGQVCRHLLSYTEADFEEVQYEDREKWFEQDKKNLGFDFPNLPYLIDGDLKLTESTAVMKYICKRSNKPELLGRDLRDQGHVENLIGVFNDVMKELRTLFGPHDATATGTVLGKIKPKLDLLKAFAGGKEFMMGYPTLIDFILSENLYYVETIIPGEKKHNLFWWRIRKNVENLPGVQAYYKRKDAIVLPFIPPTMPLKPKLHNIRLCYWKIRGAAQVARLLLHFSGMEFEDCYYEDHDKWFNEDRLHAGLDFPNLPYLIDNDTNVTEPAAIHRYIIKKWGPKELLGQNPQDSAQIESFLSVFTEVAGQVKTLFFHNDRENAKAGILERYKVKLDQLQKFVGKKPLVMNYLTVADFVVAEESHYIQRIFPEEYKTWPFLQDIRHNFEKLPQVRSYYEKDGLKGPFFPAESPINVDE